MRWLATMTPGGALALAVATLTLVSLVHFFHRVLRSLDGAPRMEPVRDGAVGATVGATVDDTMSVVVSVIVPAYNEASNIAACMNAVLDAVPPGIALELIVADDRSTDATRALADEIAARDGRVAVLAVPPPPDAAWFGKQWACSCAAARASGEYLLFIDADVRLKRGAIAASLAAARSHQADLLSFAPRLVFGCFSERLVQPLVTMLVLYNFRLGRVNDPARRGAAVATGPIMLFRRSAYDAIGGHAAVASVVTDDLTLAKLIKRRGFTLAYLIGTDFADLTMYRSLGALWEGWTKNFHAALNRDIWRSAGAAAAILALFVVPWITLAASLAMPLAASLTASARGEPVALAVLALSCAAIAVQVAGRLAVGRRLAMPARHLWLDAPLAWAGGALVAAIILASIVKIETGRGWTWRGRALGPRSG